MSGIFKVKGDILRMGWHSECVFLNVHCTLSSFWLTARRTLMERFNMLKLT